MQFIKSILAALVVLFCQHAVAQQRDVYVVILGVPPQVIEGAPVQGVGPSGGYTFAAQSFQHGLASSQTSSGPVSQAARTIMGDLVLTKATGVTSYTLLK